MNAFCQNCQKDGRTMVQLTCEHGLCLECAEGIKVAEGVGPLDAKFRICCPTCRKSTITLNIQNLVSRDNEKLLFVNMESSQLSEQQLQQQFGGEGRGRISESKLRKMSYTERRSSVYAERRTPEGGERSKGHDSRASNSRSRAPQLQEVKCSVHKEALMFYCEQEAAVMCMQCMYRHMKEQKNHNVCSLSDALGAISRLNLDFKAEARQRIEEVDRNLAICRGNKTRIQQAYEIHQQMIGQQFRELQQLIRKKQQQNRDHLAKVFKRKEEEIEDQIHELNYIRGCLKQHHEFSTQGSSAQVYFFNAFQLLRQAMSKYTLSYKQIKKEEFFCFDKFASLEDFSSLLERFYRPREGGRESKTTSTLRKEESNGPSRASEKGAGLKIKQQFYEEAKKKLEKLNKMENEHNNHNYRKKNSKEEYLQNFFIEDMEHSCRPPTSAAPSYRKSSASQYVQRKGGQKTLTPTRVTPTPTGTKSRKK